MDDFDDMEYDRESANSEIRYLTLELMKIAVREKKPFKQVVKEFIENVYFMKETLSEIEKKVKESKDIHERERKKSNKPY